MEVQFVKSYKKSNNKIIKNKTLSLPSLSISNDKIIELIKSDKPFYISRLGGVETYYAFTWDIFNKTSFDNGGFIHQLQNNAGIYYPINNKNDLLKFMVRYAEQYGEAIQKSDILACFDNLCYTSQLYYTVKYNISSIDNSCLFIPNLISQNITPWSYYLKEKTILIISPFVDSFKKQKNNHFRYFKNNKPLFHKNQKFIYYKCYNTAAGNDIHNDWIETLTLMKKDIKEIDFDIALLACGGYGLLLCQYIRDELNKSSIYCGGIMQLMFGVIGERWITDKDNKINTENVNIDNFIKPSKKERPNNYKVIENGCYW